MFRVRLDLTPWFRAPDSGIGRAAVGTYRAVRRRLDESPVPGLEVEAVTQTQALELEEIKARPLSWLRAWRGEPRTALHTFHHRMPPYLRGRRILTFHDAWTLRPNRFQSADFQRGQAPKLRDALKRSDLVVTPTAVVRGQLEREEPGLGAEISVIPWGFDVPRGSSAEPLELPARFVAMVGIVEVRKNLTYAVEALASFPDLSFLIVGRPGFNGDEILSDLRNRFGPRIVHRMAVSEVERQRIYREAEAVVLPSLDEGFGLVSIEAAASGANLLLSDIPPFREILPEAAKFSLDDQGQGLRALFRESRDRSAEERAAYRNRLESAVRRFSWDATGAAHVRLYSRLAGLGTTESAPD